MYGFLADLMVAIHIGYVGYVVVGQLLIWLGWAMGRQFVRNFWFRATHLLAIAVVAYEEVMDIRCPLSIWEEHFRETGRAAGNWRDLPRPDDALAALPRFPAVGLHGDLHDDIVAGRADARVLPAAMAVSEPDCHCCNPTCNPGGLINAKVCENCNIARRCDCDHLFRLRRDKEQLAAKGPWRANRQSTRGGFRGSGARMGSRGNPQEVWCAHHREYYRVVGTAGWSASSLHSLCGRRMAHGDWGSKYRRETSAFTPRMRPIRTSLHFNWGRSKSRDAKEETNPREGERLLRPNTQVSKACAWCGSQSACLQ